MPLRAPPSPDFPASYLKSHLNVSWFVDENASVEMAYRSWKNPFSKEDMQQGLIDIVTMQQKSLFEITMEDLKNIGISVLQQGLALGCVDFQQTLIKCLARLKD